MFINKLNKSNFNLVYFKEVTTMVINSLEYLLEYGLPNLENLLEKMDYEITANFYKRRFQEKIKEYKKLFSNLQNDNKDVFL